MISAVRLSGVTALLLAAWSGLPQWQPVLLAQADVTPPTIAVQSPPNLTAGVSAAVRVTASFTEPVQPGSITFVLRDSSNSLVPGSMLYDAATRTATLTPTSALSPSTTFTATISGVTDLAGNAIVAPAVWSFSTGAVGFFESATLTGLVSPTVAQFAPDGRIFVAEKSGLIKVFASLTDTSPGVFADLITQVNDSGNRGLIGMALDPGFPARPYVYVLYTYDAPIHGTAPTWGTPGVPSDQCPDPDVAGCAVSARISRLQAAGGVATGPELVLVEDWFQQYPGQSVGGLAFGPDGALYASAGDGASSTVVDTGQNGNPGGDPPNEGGALRSQDLTSPPDPVGLDGSVIRVNPDTGRALPRTTSMTVAAPTTDQNGVKSYSVTSVFQGPSPTVVRVLEPTNPVAGKPRRFLYVLPVEVGVSTLASTWSDGLEELRLLDVPNRFNVTLIAPSFNIEPWYGDHASDPDRRLESFVVRGLVPFGDSFAAPGTIPQRWAIGFSKSGFGALTLVLRYPNVFSAVAAWDAPAQITDVFNPPCACQVAANFGTQENFNQYVIPSLVASNAAPFLTRNRIWISGDQSSWTADMNQLHTQMVQAGIVHTWVSGGARAHSWASGWLNGAVTSLDQNASAVSPVDENADRIVAYGLRSPSRFAFRPGTSEIWLGDIGWNGWEEINRIDNSQDGVVENFGWPCYEGASATAYGTTALCARLTPPKLTPPVYAYQHNQSLGTGDTCAAAGGSISGLAFYGGGTYPSAYQGAMFFADAARNCIWVMSPGQDGRPDPSTRRTFLNGTPAPVDLRTGPAGDLFYVSRDSGQVRRITYVPGNSAPTASIQSSISVGDAPLPVTFNGGSSFDPDGSALTFSWDLDGDGVYGDATSAQATATYTIPGTYIVRLRVFDATGLSDVRSTTITVLAAGSPPVRSAGAPSGTLATGTTQATLSLTTNENATCRYGTVPGTAYAVLPSGFSTTGGMAHTTVVTGLASGAAYSYAVRCQDANGNANTDDFTISFSVAAIPVGLAAGYWLDEGTGSTTADASVNNTTGTLVNAPIWTTGRYGNALSFGGTNYVDLGNPASLKLSGSMTVSAWINITANPFDDADIVGKAGPHGWILKTTPDTGVRTAAIQISSNASDYILRYSASTLTANTWYHIAGVYNAATRQLDIYVNGVLDNGVLSGTVPASQYDAPFNVSIAQRTGNPGTFNFQGRIDQVHVYNSALAAAEVQADMSAFTGGGPDTTPPVRSAGAPSGTLAAGTTQATLSLTTSENATCRYGTVPGTAYAALPTAFTTTGGLTQSTVVTGLVNNGTYSYVVRCQDPAGNANPDDFTINFSVAGSTTPTISISDATVTEGNTGTTNAAFVVSLSAASSQTVTVHYATATGTATAPDFTATSGTATFSPGMTTQTVNVPVVGDLLNEGNETFVVNLTVPVNATIADAQGAGTIVDDDPLPSLTINNVSITEGNSGTKNATFTVTLSAVSGRSVSVNYATANGTATSGTDYTAKTGTVTIAAGSLSGTLTVSVKGDTTVEPHETFLVNLSGATNATIAQAQGTGTILNDDGTPTIAISDVTVTEGNTGTTNAAFVITLSAVSAQTITVNYATAAGTATAADFTATSGTATFAPNTTTQIVNVPVVGDLLDEAAETFVVNLTAPVNATIADSQGVGTILDDDSPPAISIGDATVTEGNAGTINAVFTLSLSAASGQVVSVSYATADGSALAASDYTAAAGVATFAAGTTTQTVTVPVRGDTVFEPNETFVVNLSNPVNATVADAQGLGTIVNDDSSSTAPTITTAAGAAFTVGTAGSFAVATTGAPTPSLSATGVLPGGVTFANNGNGTATLSGAPLSGSGGTYALTITATNGVLPDATQSFTLTVSQAPAITSAASAMFTVGTAGTVTVTATGAPIPTLSETGALPSGVTFNASTGVLSGTPATGTSGTYPIIFTASNGVTPNATQSFALTVSPAPQAPAITSAASATFAVGSAGTFTVTATGVPTPALSETGPLPSGVTFNASTGVLSGTPAAGTSGTYPFTLTASNSVSPDATQSFTLTVNQSPAITSATTTTFTAGAAGSFTVTATGVPTPALSESGALPSGVTFNASTGVLSGTPAVGSSGAYPLTLMASNGVTPNATQNFTLTVSPAPQAPAITSPAGTTFTVGSAGTFTVMATGAPTPTFFATGALPSGVTFNATTGVLSGIPAAGTSGTYILTVTASNGVGTDATQDFTLSVNQPPAITSAAGTTFTVGTAGTFTLMATGVPTPTLSTLSGLPSGVTLVNNGNGTATLSGTPGAGTAGTYNFTLTASNGVSPDATQSFTLTVSPAPQAPAITSAAGATFTVGAPGTFTVTATGVPTPALSETGALPSGVTFNASTGALSGTLAQDGRTYDLTLTAGNGVSPDATQTFTLRVNQAPAITSAAGATFTVGTAGIFAVTATGTPTPSVTQGGTLPSGVTFDAGTRVLSGTPAAGTGGTYTVTFTASNGVGTPATQNFTLTVNQPPAITSAAGTTFTTGTAGTFTVTATGTPTPSVTQSGTLPSGVTFNAGTRVLSGTPAAGTGGTYTVTFTAGNGVGTPATQSFTLTVTQAPAISSAASATFTVGTAGSFTVTATGSPTPSITQGARLPSGVTFNAGTRVLSGTPGAGTAGTYSITFTASNGVSPSAVQTFTLTVSNAGSNFAYVTGSVTGAFGVSGSSATLAVALHQNPLAGHALICAATWQSSTATASMSDPNNGSWTPIGAVKTGTGTLAAFRGQMFYVPSTLTAATTVTLTLSSAVAFRAFECAEYSYTGTAAALDGTPQYSTTRAAASVATISGLTTVNPSDLVFVGCLGVDTACSAGAGYTGRNDTNAYDAVNGTFGNNFLARTGQLIEDKVNVPAGAQSATFGTGSATDDVILGLAALRGSS